MVDSGVQRSVNLRLDRAEQYLEELDVLVDTYDSIDPYIVAEGIEGTKKEAVYRLRCVAEPDEMIAVVVGDFLHNIRAALNYCMAGLVPNSRRGKTQFPIFTKDPFRQIQGSRKYVEREPDGRRRWRRYVEGVDPKALAIIESVQPYKTARLASPTYLGLLSRINNRDKHSQLVVVTAGVRPVLFTVTDSSGRRVDEGGKYDNIMLEDGIEIFRSPTPVQVKIEYDTVVALKIGKLEKIPTLDLADLAENVRANAIAPLTPYLRW